MSMSFEITGDHQMAKYAISGQTERSSENIYIKQKHFFNSWMVGRM